MSTPSLQPVAEAICAAHGYSFIKRVGAGAFKETFHVRLSDGSDQALKLFQQANSAERTQREIDAMLRCTHPNIGRLTLLDVFQHGSTIYLYSLEEFLPGGTLTDRVRTQLLSPDETFSLGQALIDAVAHIASHRLVHRDLKPDNIMFRADGVTPVVVDFGLVRMLTSTSLTQTWVAAGPGTPYYSAPEQLTNNKDLIDWRTDQFALAVLLSQCALGYHPYAEPGDDAGQLLNRVARRIGPSQQFMLDAARIGLPELVMMAAPWPIGRHRMPQELLTRWQGQQGGVP